MLRRWVLAFALLAALAAALLQGAPPAQAAFHCMRIHAVKAGADQYVELRLVAGLLTGASNSTKLLFFDAMGNPSGTPFTLGSTSGFSSTPGSILFGTTGLQAAAGVTPDFIIPANVIAPAGKVQLVHNLNCVSMSGEGTIVDSVAYGSGFMGTVDCGTTPAVALPTAGTQSLTLQNVNLTCSANSAEYALQEAAPRNNGGTTGSFAPAPSVGGIGGVAEGAVSQVDSTVHASDGSSGPPYALIAGASAAATVAIAAGAWYARRRWLG